MHNITVTVFHQPELEDILRPGERLLWSGRPSHGRRFYQAIGRERTSHFSFLFATIVLWGTLPLIEANDQMGGAHPAWIYGALTISFCAVSFSLASDRQYVLSNLTYFLTDKRAIVCRRGRNWRFATRLYVISCPLSETYPYYIVPGCPYPSLQIGIMLSDDLVQPFGFGLSHPGQPPLQGRVYMPVLFEHVPNAQELLGMIQSCARARSTCAEE